MPPPINTPSDAAMFQQLALQLDGVMRRLDDLTSSVNRLAVFEERQINDRAAVDRAFTEIRGTQSGLAMLDARVKTLEIAHPANRATAGAVQKVAWLVMAAVIGALLALVLNRQPPPIHAPPAGSLPYLPAKP